MGVNIIKVTKFVDLCKKNQFELKSWLYTWLKKYYKEVVSADGFLYAKGTDKILLTAHMDTIHQKQCKSVSVKKKGGKTILTSDVGIGGDDRCGVWMIMQIVETTKLRPYILFCEDEEIGGVGSDKFVETKYSDDLFDMLFMIELDRANANDLVFYDDENFEFHNFCEEVTGYKEAFGSFSDISTLCPAAWISGVNISCGYYNAHTLKEYVVWEEMQNSISATIELMNQGLKGGVQFEYVKAKKYYSYGNYGYGVYDKSLWGDENEWNKYLMQAEEEYEESGNDKLSKVQFFDGNGAYYDVNAETFNEAVGKLMQMYPTLCWNDIIDFDCYK